MAIQYFIPKPNVVEAVQWTGDNWSEIESFVGDIDGIDLVNNGDGTLLGSIPSIGSSWSIETGQYVSRSANVVYGAADMQSVSSTDIQFVVE